MKNIAFFVAFFLVMALFAVHARADQVGGRVVAPANAAQCPMHGDSSINVSFNSTPRDITGVKAMVDGKIAEVEALAREAGLESFDMQSMNYSVNANPNTSGGCMSDQDKAGMSYNYQVYGNASFKVQPAGKATDFLALLVKKGYTANLNVNSYRQCQ